MSYMRSEARARQILECAKRVFAERGFHAANVSHICAAAGIGRGTLYLYFANKKAVFTAIVREDERTLRIVLREAVGLDVDVEKLLGEIDETLIALVAADLADSQKAGI